MIGIRYFVFAVNKMDLAKYSEERFREIEKQIEALKAELGLENVYIVPVSATEGDNVTKASDNMTWYEGKPILSILEQVDIDENQVIRDCKFKTFGCGAAVATSSMATELGKGKTIYEALQITNKAVMEALDGLPPVKVHCSLLAEEAIHEALWDYAEKHHIKIEGLQRPVNDISEKEEAPGEEY